MHASTGSRFQTPWASEYSLGLLVNPAYQHRFQFPDSGGNIRWTVDPACQYSFQDFGGKKLVDPARQYRWSRFQIPETGHADSSPQHGNMVPSNPALAASRIHILRIQTLPEIRLELKANTAVTESYSTHWPQRHAADQIPWFGEADYKQWLAQSNTRGEAVAEQIAVPARRGSTALPTRRRLD